MSGCKNPYFDERNQITADADIKTRSEDKRYLETLEAQYICMQREVLQLSTRLANLQFNLRQIIDAEPDEQEDLLKNLEALLFAELMQYECHKASEKDDVNYELKREENFGEIFGNLEDKLSKFMAQIQFRFTPLDEVDLEIEEEPVPEPEPTEDEGELVEEDSSALRCGQQGCGKGKKAKKDEKDEKAEPIRDENQQQPDEKFEKSQNLK